MSEIMKLTEVTALKADYKPSVGEIAERVENGTIVFDNVSQRGPVWDQARKSCLIRTILRNGSVQKLLARDENRNDVKVLSVIEGQQRCRAVSEYVADEFPLTLGDFNCIFEYKGESVELEGKYFKDLPQSFQDKIRNYIFTIEYYTDLSDADANEMYYFSNNGKPMATIQQIWSMTKSKAQITEIGESSEIFGLIGSAKTQANFAYRQMIMHAHALLRYKKGQGLEAKALLPIYKDYDITPEEVADLKRVYVRMFNIRNHLMIMQSNKKIPKKVINGFMGKTHFVSLTPMILRSLNENRTDEEVAEWIAQFFNAPGKTTISETYNSTTNSTLKPVNVEKRLSELEKNYNKFFRKIDKEKPAKEVVQNFEEVVLKFYDLCVKEYDTDRRKLKEWLMKNLGHVRCGGSNNGINYQCSPRGVKLENAEEITWARFVQMINKLVPVKENEEVKEENTEEPKEE